jgi:hypothetical protein
LARWAVNNIEGNAGKARQILNNSAVRLCALFIGYDPPSTSTVLVEGIYDL